MGEQKVRVAFHEAGHVTMNLIWLFPWSYAELIAGESGSVKGVVRRDSFEKFDTPKKLFIKEWMVGVAGFLSEEIFLGKELDLFSEGRGSLPDFSTCQQSGLLEMDSEFYHKNFSPFMLQLTKDCLKKNWANCVVVVANQLFQCNRIEANDIDKKIQSLFRPDSSTLDQIVHETKWKN